MLGAIVGAIAKALLGALASIFGQRQTRADQIELGQERQRAATDKAVEQRVEKADEVERRVDAASDPERERLRARWTRPGA